MGEEVKGKEKYYVSTLGLTLTQLFLFFTIGGVLITFPLLRVNIISNHQANLFVNNCILYLLSNLLVVGLTFIFIFRPKWYYFTHKDGWKSIIINFSVQMGLISLFNINNIQYILGIIQLAILWGICFLTTIGTYWLLRKLRKTNIDQTGEINNISATYLGFAEFAIQILIFLFFLIINYILCVCGIFVVNNVFEIALGLLFFLSNTLTTIRIVIFYRKRQSLFTNNILRMSIIWSFSLQVILLVFLAYISIFYIHYQAYTYKILIVLVRNELPTLVVGTGLCFLSTIGTYWIINKISNKRGV